MELNNAGSCACRCVDRVQAMEPRWGVLYFAYDWFSAIRTDMVREVRHVFPLLSRTLSCTHPAYLHHLHVCEGKHNWFSAIRTDVVREVM